MAVDNVLTTEVVVASNGDGAKGSREKLGSVAGQAVSTCGTADHGLTVGTADHGPT